MDNIAKIYVLIDPSDYEIRYVGKTSVDLNSRLSKHIYQSKNKTDYKSNWINKLVRLGLKPRIELLQKVKEDFWKECEIYWIAYFNSIGCKLTNTDPGGLGQKRGFKKSKESILKWKISRQKSGYKQSPESIKKGIETRRKNGTLNHSKETKQKMSEATKKRNSISEETRKRLSDSHKGYVMPEDQKLKIKISLAKSKKLNKYGCKGVSWHNQTEKWRIRFGKKHLGLSDNKIEAMKIYDKYLIDTYGKSNCITNKILGIY